MSPAIFICVVWLGGVIACGALAAAVVEDAPGRSGHARGPWARAVGAVDALTSEIGRLATAAVVVLAGWSVVIITGWVLGEVAHALEDAVDWPVFDWFRDHQVDGWSQAWQRITDIGSPQVTAVVAVTGAVALGALWWKRDRAWWLPGLSLVLGLVLVRYAQFLLKEVVDRGHPPTTLGTWPSGGCARVIVVYGLIMFFLVRASGRGGRRPWIGWATATAFLVSVQGYARTYNLEHWVTDVVGGTIFGAMVIALVIAFVAIVERRPVTTPPAGQGLAGRRPVAVSGGGRRRTVA